jgi:hypothetical protein
MMGFRFYSFLDHRCPGLAMFGRTEPYRICANLLRPIGTPDEIVLEIVQDWGRRDDTIHLGGFRECPFCREKLL